MPKLSVYKFLAYFAIKYFLVISKSNRKLNDRNKFMFHRRRKKIKLLNKTNCTHQEFKQRFIQNPFNLWLLEQKNLLRSIFELVDLFNKDHLNRLLAGNEIVFLLASGEYACTINPPENTHLILVFPELRRLLSNVDNERGLAVLAHEIGHLYHQHYLRDISTIESQIEADDFAFQCGLGHGLVEVLLNYRDIDSQTRVSILTSKILSNHQSNILK